MKTKRFSFLAGVSLAAALILSCSALKDALNETVASFTSLTSSNLLQNSRAGFMSSNGEGVPDGDVDVIDKVEINGSAIQGGSTSITVTATQRLDTLFIQIEGENGYYAFELEPGDLISSGNGRFVYQIDLVLNTNIGEGDEGLNPTITVSGKTKGGDTTVSKSEQLVIKQVGSGKLQISLSWDNSDDVDLYVWSPGETRPLFFGGPVQVDYGEDGIYKTENGNGYLDLDANAGCRSDEVAKKINGENIYFKNLEDGEYKIAIQLYSKCEPIGAPGARYNVTANVKGKFVDFGQKNDQFPASETGALTSLGSSYPTESTSNTIIIGTIKIENGEFQQ